MTIICFFNNKYDTAPPINGRHMGDKNMKILYFSFRFNNTIKAGNNNIIIEEKPIDHKRPHLINSISSNTGKNQTIEILITITAANTIMEDSNKRINNINISPLLHL